MEKTLEDIKNFIEKIINFTGVEITKIEFSDDPDIGIKFLSVETKDAENLLKREPEIISAISTLVSRFSQNDENPKEDLLNINLDINNSQKKHIEDIKTKAHMMAERAKFFKSSIEMEPMNGYDRRIVHLFLEKNSNLKTESVGAGKERRVVITCID